MGKRVLFTSHPLYGHVNTMLPLARAAQRAGHHVAFATGADLTTHVARRGARPWSVGPAGGPADPAIDWIEYFLTSAAQRTPELVARAQQWKPDLVVHDETDLAGAVAAVHSGAEHVVHGLGVMPPGDLWTVFEPALDRLFYDEGIDLAAEAVRDAVYLQVCPQSLQPAWPELIWKRTTPLRHSSGSPAPGDHRTGPWERLPYEQLVHLTLGTMFGAATDVLRAALSALRSLPVNVVVTVGPNMDPGVLGPQPAHVIVARYVDHSVLLPHCSLVISHGGAGTMFGALGHGVPQLVLPQGADQELNAAALEATGAGLVLRGEDVRAVSVFHTAAKLLTEPDFADRAAGVKRAMAAMPSPAQVVGSLL